MRRFYFIFGLLALVLLLHYLFPYALQDEGTRTRLLYLVLLLSLGFVGGRRAFRRAPTGLIRDGAIWLSLIICLMLAYSLRDEFGHNRLLSELMPARAQVTPEGALVIRASLNGHFMLEGKVNGVSVLFLIDTGASDIVLSPDDAMRAGFDPEALDYDRFYTTANGAGRGADVVIRKLEAGPVRFDEVSASVNKAPMEQSLLGMNFLRRFQKFQMEGDRLVLTP